MSLARRRAANRPTPLGSGRPRFPIWKDEKLLGLISLRALLTLVVIGGTAFMILIVWGFFKLSDVSADNDRQTDTNAKLTQSNTELIKKIQDLQKQGKADRLANQSRTDAEIRNLACSALQLIPPNSKQADQFYQNLLKINIRCQKPGEKFTPTPLPGNAPPLAPTRTPSSVAPDAPRLSSSQPRPSAKPSAPSTVIKPGPGSTTTKTVSNTPAPSPKATLPIVGCITIPVTNIKVNCP